MAASNSLSVAHWEQYEVWRLNENRWELVGYFPDFDMANAVVRNRTNRVRLIHAIYEDSTVIEKEVLMELGAPREHP
jgi:hypothetical protein